MDFRVFFCFAIGWIGEENTRKAIVFFLEMVYTFGNTDGVFLRL